MTSKSTGKRLGADEKDEQDEKDNKKPRTDSVKKPRTDSADKVADYLAVDDPRVSVTVSMECFEATLEILDTDVHTAQWAPDGTLYVAVKNTQQCWLFPCEGGAGENLAKPPRDPPGPRKGTGDAMASTKRPTAAPACPPRAHRHAKAARGTI